MKESTATAVVFAVFIAAALLTSNNPDGVDIIDAIIYHLMEK